MQSMGYAKKWDKPSYEKMILEVSRLKVVLSVVIIQKPLQSFEINTTSRKMQEGSSFNN